MKIEINNIPDLNYEGYLWYSDEPKPEFVKGKLDKTKLTKLPFVIEGNLWAETEKVSINIKNIDSEYVVTKFDIPSKFSSNEYLAHDLEGVDKYKMYQHWEESTEDLPIGMSSLQPAWAAFTGFIYNTKNK